MELFYPTNSLLALYLFIAVLLTDAASDFKWSVCDSTSYFEVKNVTMNPLPAKPGGRLETIIEGAAFIVSIFHFKLLHACPYASSIPR